MTRKSSWQKTSYVGVRYKEDPERKNRGLPDRYYSIRYKKNGKTIEEAAGWASHGMNPQRANLLRAEIIQNIREGKRPQSLSEKRETERAREETKVKEAEKQKQDQYSFGEAAEAFINWAKVNKKSWKDDQGRHNNYVKKIIGKIPMKDVSPIHLERIKSEMKKKGLSDKTIHHALTLIRSVYLKHISWGLYAGPIPTKQVKLPILDNKRTRFLSYEEAKLLVAELKKLSLTVFHQAMIALNCGLRFSEIARLRWSDIDLNHGVMHVRDTKSGMSREVYITKTVGEILTFLNDVNQFKNDDLIFPDKTGKPQQHVSNSFYLTVKDMGFNENIADRRQKVCFHTLRHSFGSWLAMQSTSLYEIKELMGHSDIKMTERYAHLLPSVKRDAVNRMTATFDQTIIEEPQSEIRKSGKKGKKVIPMK